MIWALMWNIWKRNVNQDDTYNSFQVFCELTLNLKEIFQIIIVYTVLIFWYFN